MSLPSRMNICASMYKKDNAENMNWKFADNFLFSASIMWDEDDRSPSCIVSSAGQVVHHVEINDLVSSVRSCIGISIQPCLKFSSCYLIYPCKEF